MRIKQWLLAVVALPVTLGATLANEPANQAIESVQAQQNQLLADSLAEIYKSSGRLSGYSLNIEAQAGFVTLTGQVASEEQLAKAIELTRQHPGVRGLRHQVQVQTATMAKPILPISYRQDTAPGEAPNTLSLTPEGANDLSMDPPANGLPGTPGMTGLPPGVANPAVEPAPVKHFPGGLVPYADAPVLPPYSWPAYTPYNNYASLAYQTQYPAGAWPFIGPPYPYPMIPSGWRRVTLKWKRGYWWMHFHGH